MEVSIKEVITSIIAVLVLILITSYIGTLKEPKEEPKENYGLQQEGILGMPIPSNGDVVAQEQNIQKELPKYKLTDEERDLIERVVMGMTEHEDITTQKAVAQCILNACNITNKRPEEIIKSLRYPLYRPEPTDEVKESVSKIFDDGEIVIDKNAMYLYAPSDMESQWHETQQYICTIGKYKFFARNKN